MDLYKEILINVLSYERAEISFQNVDIKKMTESRCYLALEKIKKTLKDDSLEDDECFLKIEEIVGTIEELGSDAGARHDFG